MSDSLQRGTGLTVLKLQVLHKLLTFGAIFAALVIGSWVLPLGLAVFYEGWAGMARIPRFWYFFAHPGPWFELPSSRTLRAIGAVIMFAPIGVLIVAFDRLAERSFFLLVVRIFRWVTREDYEKARKLAGKA